MMLSLSLFGFKRVNHVHGPDQNVQRAVVWKACSTLSTIFGKNQNRSRREALSGRSGWIPTI
jgi:hypothetical protein